MCSILLPFYFLLLRIIIELHTNMRSCVAYKGHKSFWFDILEGSRQGGVLSLFLYMCFTDDLLEELCRCPARRDVPVGVPLDLSAESTIRNQYFTVLANNNKCVDLKARMRMLIYAFVDLARIRCFYVVA